MEIENDKWFEGEEAQRKQIEFECEIFKEQHKIESIFPREFTFKERVEKHTGNEFMSALIMFCLDVYNKDKIVATSQYSIDWWFPQKEVFEEWLDLKNIEDKFLYCFDDSYMKVLKKFGEENKYDKLIRR